MTPFHRFKLFTLTGILLLLSTCTTTQTTTQLSEKEQKDYLQKGQVLAQQSFAALSGRLMSAIETGGVPHAIEYCHTAALPLVDSLSKVYQASIRRTSLKVRNPEDVPLDWEKTILQSFQQELAAGKRPTPVVKVLDKKHIAFVTPTIYGATLPEMPRQIGRNAQ